MSEGTEIDERVDLEEDNYEEVDDDVEDQLDEDVEEDPEENDEQDDDDSKDGDNPRDQSPEMDTSHADDDAVEEEQKLSASISEEEKQKHAEILALPPHGAEVFIGGLPKDVMEDDLRDLCEPFGEIFEVITLFSLYIWLRLVYFGSVNLSVSFQIVLQVRLMKDKDTGEGKGFAFVGYKSKDVAQKTIEELHGKEFKVSYHQV